MSVEDALGWTDGRCSFFQPKAPWAAESGGVCLVRRTLEKTGPKLRFGTQIRFEFSMRGPCVR